MRLLPRDPVRRNSALAMVLAAVGVYLFHARLRVPRAKRADALEARVEDVREKNRQAKSASAAGGAALATRLARYESHLRRLETLIPAGGDVAQLLEAVSEEARRAGVEMTMMRPRPRIEGEFYEQWGYDLAVRGGYHAVGSFLASVASLERIVVPDAVVVARQPAPAAAREILATLEIRTYVAVAPSAEAGAGRGAGAVGGHPSAANPAPVVQAALPPPPRGPQASQALVFEREVFRYPATGRRDPFAAPPDMAEPAGAGLAPRLLGLILHEDPRMSIALLARERRDGAPARPLRLRTGEQAAGLRLVRIARDGVTVEIGSPNGNATRATLSLPKRKRPAIR